MWRIAAITLALIVSLSAQAVDRAITKHYWTYQEFSDLFKQKQLSAKDFASFVRTKGNSYSTNRIAPIQIAIIYPGKQASDYWRRSVSSFEARLKESTIPYEIRTYFSKPGDEIRLQAKHISQALKENPDYLIFTLDALKHRLMIERLIAQQRPKVILQNITTPLKEWGETQPFMYVGFDHASGTEVLAHEYLKRFNEGKYAIFYGPKGYVSQMRGGTFKARMSSNSNLALVAEYYVGFNRKKAHRAALKLLKEQPNLKFIFSCSTDIALGVMDAIKELGMQNQVITNGWGGGSSELNALSANELEMTVMRMNDDNGAAMAEAVLWQLQNRTVPTVYSGDMLLVTKEMSVQEIKRLSNRAFRYSDSWTSDINQILRSEASR